MKLNSSSSDLIKEAAQIGPPSSTSARQDAIRVVKPLFQGDGSQNHLELVSYRGGRHILRSDLAAETIVDAMLEAGLAIWGEQNK